MKYTLTKDDLKTLGNGIRNANSMSVEEHLDAFLAYKPTDDWQVIASGKVEFVAGDTHINGESEWEWTGRISNILTESYQGKNVEIAVRVKEE